MSWMTNSQTAALWRKPSSLYRRLGIITALGVLLSEGCATPPPTDTAPTASANVDAKPVHVTLPVDDTSTDWEFVQWLHAGGVEVAKDANGDDLIVDSPTCRTILVRYRRMLHVRLDLTAQNLANINTTHDAQGAKNPYRRRLVVADPGGGLQIVNDPSPLPLHYEPGSPYADSNGYVQYPNVDATLEQVNAIQTSRSYRVVTRILKQFDPTFLDAFGEELPEIHPPAPVTQTTNDTAQEQTLARIIERFPGVNSAKVKINPKQMRIESSDPPSATVFLTTTASEDQKRILAAAAARTVANAVPGVTVGNVSVVINGVAVEVPVSSNR